MSWEQFAVAVGGFSPLITVGAIIAAQEFSARAQVCADILKKLEETKQIYIVEHDMPISVSKTLFDLLDRRRREEARKRGIPEVQYEWEDLLWMFLGR